MKKLWIIVILVIAGLIWWMSGDNKLPSYLGSTTSPTASVVATKTPATVKKPTATPVATPTLSYSQLVQQYGSNRIQFDSNCYAQPKTMVLKSGTSILLDNRSSQTRVIAINGNNYTLGGYGYQVVTVQDSSLPKNVGVTCNNQINSGMINLQATISGQ